jgi:predicted neutral ceramidase superfamily lipid hydrolase
MSGKGDDGRSASHDDEYSTLLEEIRVLLPGVEVLFAFLLTVPFTGRFERISDLQRLTYFVAFLSASASVILLIAPSVYHRVRWREAHKEDVLHRANALALTGTAFFAIAITAVVYTVTDVLYGAIASSALAGLVAVTAFVLWFGLALRDRRSGNGRSR